MATTIQRQRELLRFIFDYVNESGYSPTLKEMREYMEFSSNQAVLDLLRKMELRGLIKKDISIARSIKILSDGYKDIGETPQIAILGTTSAGVPMEVVEISGEWMTTPESNVAIFKDNVFLLKISGDSMINAGIEDGDLVLVKEQKEFISGDIVLAQIGDESTVKRFISQDNPPCIYLKPGNPKYENILFTENTQLKGKVISVLKNGQWKSIK
jgi:repressor LexA